MNREEIRRLVVRTLCDVAPEIRPESIDPRGNLRDDLDLDSVDFMNFAVGLHAAFGVDVPESDYPRLASLDECVAYLAEKTGS